MIATSSEMPRSGASNASRSPTPGPRETPKSSTLSRATASSLPNPNRRSNRPAGVLVSAFNIDVRRWALGVSRPGLSHSQMKVLVTGGAGHLGEALVRTLRRMRHEIVGLDIRASPFTDRVGSIVDRAAAKECMKDVNVVLHTATLHKPHVATHSRHEFVDTNVTGTLNLLEEAAAAGVESFVFTSTTSVFGAALTPPKQEPAAWITEEVHPIPRNIYGATKAAAEDLCELFHRQHGLACMIL